MHTRMCAHIHTWACTRCVLPPVSAQSQIQNSLKDSTQEFRDKLPGLLWARKVAVNQSDAEKLPREGWRWPPGSGRTDTPYAIGSGRS